MLTGMKYLDYKILNELDDKDLVNACQTYKAADKICADQNFWLHRIQIKFPYLSYEMLNRYRENRKWSDYYIELIKINHENMNDYLLEGSKNNRMDYVLVALKQGADPDMSEPNFNTTALIFASLKNNLDIVKILVENGADVNEKDDMRVTPLYVAAEQGNLDIVKYLIEHNAIPYETFTGGTALMAASDKGHIDIVEYLLDTGSFINYINSSTIGGNTALFFAVSRGKTNIVKLLLERGADPNIRNDRVRVLEYAIKHGVNSNIIELLKEHGAI